MHGEKNSLFVETLKKNIKIIHIKRGKLRRQLFVSKHGAAKGPVVPVCKEAVTRQTASRWINVKAHDPNKRIISEIYCAASRVVNSARTIPKREREAICTVPLKTQRVGVERGNSETREKSKRGKRGKRDERKSRRMNEKGKRERNGEKDQPAPKLRWLRLVSFRLTPMVMPCKLY